ncbi:MULTISPECIES: L-threonylcarbamoyladenylate synthase [Culturomica]|jgi:L-threonylcarbamoyladenylate synthase|uniref:L-threonylcarbamoyladenylate synthase n=1 Tax=Culturomica TaxID=1926651 RepID=UPI000340A7D5|nr:MULTISPECIES: L-threonylcarbamoyladenylate synthase [Odoribacteraceae]RHV91853.1 threonylcarbamoyl-AMP synthase [Odoribacter sp. OF09-27XD]CCZ07254.1 sua5/YciO/YrdC/YwlC family protein [Odoribacter sp. CAG:788]HBO27350.1 threonylcarbamoyl-AMP synthase [Culturomica sp.]
MTDKLKEEVFKATEILKQGGVILYPTDTIWGLGCDATNEKAVKRIYEIKQREDNKSMLVLLDDAGKIASYADVPDIALQLIEVSDKPMTIIYPNARNLASNLINAADQTIGIRITEEEFSKSLIFRFRKPIVSTSANISGQPSPGCYAEISDEVKNAVDYIVDFRRGDKQKHTPSSIVKLDTDGTIQVIRK